MRPFCDTTSLFHKKVALPKKWEKRCCESGFRVASGIFLSLPLSNCWYQLLTLFFLSLFLLLSFSLSAVKNVGMEVVHIDLPKRCYLLCGLCGEVRARFAQRRCKKYNQ